MKRPPAGALSLVVLVLWCIAWWVAPAGSQALAATPPETASRVPFEFGTDFTLLLVYIGAALFFSFLCSLAEATLLSITPSFIAELRERHPAKAARLQRLKTDNIDRSLAAILTVNTIAHTAGAIGAGSKATAVFGDALFGVFSAVMTLMILFLTEIVPKTIGAVHWRRLTGFTEAYVRVLILSMYPLIRVSELLTKLISRGQKVHVFSREEFVAMSDVGRQSGQIDDRESKVIRNLFRFNALTARDIMTPRTVMVALQAETTVARAYELRDEIPFSRLPVYGRDKDDITGFVLYEDILLEHLRENDAAPVSSVVRELLAVPASSTLTMLMDSLMKGRQQIALVVGEYGETRGIVTMEDLVETLLGEEIVDEGDEVTDMQAMARQLWHKRAKTIGIAVDADSVDADSAGSAGSAAKAVKTDPAGAK